MKLKKIIWILIVAAGIFAQEVGSETAHHYYLPLPGTKSVANVEWQFLLEARALDGQSFQISIAQYDIRGRLLASTDFGLQPGERVFSWLSRLESVSGRLRSLEIVSDKDLAGVIWMWNDLLGQFNGVSLSEDTSQSLVVSHIPQNFFEMTTTFSVLGISQQGLSSTVNFLYYDELFRRHEPSVLRSNWPSNGYFIFTPEVTLSIGDLDEHLSASWGQIVPETDSYRLTGFQTFTWEEAVEEEIYTRTAATQLRGSGRSEGYLVFTIDESGPYEDQIVLTNPHGEQVDVSFTLLSRIIEEEKETGHLSMKQQLVTLQPFQKRILKMGQELYPENTGLPVWLYYRSDSLPGDEQVRQPLPVFALHLQNQVNGGAMGGHHFANAGERVQTWLSLSSDFENSFSLVSTGIEKVILPEEDPSDEPMEPGAEEMVPGGEDEGSEEEAEFERVKEVSLVEIEFISESGKLGPARHPIHAGQVFTVTAEELDLLYADLFGLEQLSSIQVNVRLISGPPIIANLRGNRGNDIALVNPLTTTPEPVVVPDEPVEE